MTFIGSMLQVHAQYSQLEPNTTFMFKVELGYAPFIGNTGALDNDGFALAHQQNVAEVDLVAGANLAQDWFVGGGVGGQLYHSTTQQEEASMMGATVFANAEYRPARHAVGATDYKPVAMSFAPLAGARAGVSLLMAEEMGFTPMAEVYGGISWYYTQGLHNSTHNRHSLFATLGVAYMQGAVFLPMRLGWRW